MTLHPWMYVVLLGLFLIVYARFLPKKETSASKANVVQEIEETIEHFASEMDEQNQAILNLFSKTKQDYEVELAKLSGRLESLEKQRNELSHELNKAHVNQQLNLKAMSAFQAAEEAGSASDELVRHVERTAPTPAQQTPEAGPAPAETAAEAAAETPAYTGLSMKSRYAELFALYDQGKGVEAIARKLGMNKGEVNLILQLSRQEERTRV